jgi:hypothetical protein
LVIDTAPAAAICCARHVPDGLPLTKTSRSPLPSCAVDPTAAAGAGVDDAAGGGDER